ncbi:hypothetical protein SERLADRAFT_480551, partial [Serpula lacrymans var. lacrymans S7.9]
MCPAPSSFNVIDTSNIMDHVGFINVLTVVSPLLKHSPSSVIYTDGLLSPGKNPVTNLLEHTCADLPTIAFLFDLMPTHFASRSGPSATTSPRTTGYCPSQTHERITWKIARVADEAHNQDELVNCSVVFNPQQLAKLLFNMYLNMFADENWWVKMRSLRAIQNSTLVHYVRRTFAQVLRLAMDKIEVDWEEVMDTFCQFVQYD